VTPAPACVSCGEPCRFVYTRNGNGVARRPWSSSGTGMHPYDRAILWLCSRCVDAAAREEVRPTPMPMQPGMSH
jgi:hypothetical protein